MGAGDFRQRLQDVIHELRVEHQDFARAGGITKATLSGYIQNDRQPKVDTLARWITAYEINADWLITGRGPMFGKESTENTGPQTLPGKELAEIKFALQEIGASEEEIRLALLDYVRGGRSSRDSPTGTDDDSR
ncbi:helix-turn-helix domain-containing protein [Desulfocurvus sp. DL9XJH121]